MNTYPKMIINEDNLLYNIQLFKQNYKDIKLCAVVKSNAYGHGLINISKLINNYVDYFAVNDVIEAIELRIITNKPILLLSPLLVENLVFLVDNKVDLSVSSITDLKLLIKYIEQINSVVNVHIKVDTGMNRYGVKNIKEFEKMLAIILKHNKLILRGIYSHFYNANDNYFIEKQYKSFMQYKNIVKDTSVIFHIASSSSFYKNTSYCLDMVRLGLFMYGYEEIDCPLKPKPILKVVTRVDRIGILNKNSNLGYGNYLVERKSKYAVLHIGYSNGLNRKLSNNYSVLINGYECEIIGNICMNCCFVRLPYDASIKIGDEAIICGETNNNLISVKQIARIVGTIPHEIILGFSNIKY